MKIILLCKGKSVSRITKENILSHDCIAWANIHNLNIINSNIPKKLDYLFIREESFVNDLSDEQKKIINNLNISNVITTGIHKVKKILKYNVNKHINTKSINFSRESASTGLIALYHLITLKPETITIAGLDLFEINKPLYYFDDMNDNLTANDNNKSLNKSINNDGKLTTTFRYPNETIDFINNLIKQNQNIKFVFYTENNNLKK